MNKVIWSLILLVVSWFSCLMAFNFFLADETTVGLYALLAFLQTVQFALSHIMLDIQKKSMSKIDVIIALMPCQLPILFVKWFRGLPNA